MCTVTNRLPERKSCRCFPDYRKEDGAFLRRLVHCIHLDTSCFVVQKKRNTVDPGSIKSDDLIADPVDQPRKILTKGTGQTDEP